MNKSKVSLLLAVVSLILAPRLLYADSAMDTLIDRILAAYGGEKISSVRAYRMAGTVTAEMRQTGGTLERLFARPDRLTVLLGYPVDPEQRYLDGKRGWRTDPAGSGIAEVDGALLKSMVLQAARADIPWILDERRASVAQAPAATVGDRTTIGLQVILEPGLILRLYVDPKTSLVVFSQALLNTDRLQTHFETAYSDFREVDGVVFPHHEENWASGFHTGTTEIQKITINPEIKPDSFRPE